MTQHFNFSSEAECKYDISLREEVMLTFDQLPLAGIVNGKFFAVHGGIGPAITLESVSSVDRNGEPPREGLMCDLLWSDPVVDKIAYDGQAVEFLPNDTR